MVSECCVVVVVVVVVVYVLLVVAVIIALDERKIKVCVRGAQKTQRRARKRVGLE